MYEALAGLVGMMIRGIVGGGKLAAKAKREKYARQILVTYYVLKDLADEGLALLEDAGPDPLTLIRSLPAEEAARRAEYWDIALRRQTQRLYWMQGALLGPEHLNILDPGLVEDLTEAVGDKMDGTMNLFAIGAMMFFRSESSEEKLATFIKITAGLESNELIDLEKARANVADLTEALDRFRGLLKDLLNPEELATLSAAARRESRIGEHGMGAH